MPIMLSFFHSVLSLRRIPLVEEQWTEPESGLAPCLGAMEGDEDECFFGDACKRPKHTAEAAAMSPM